MDFSIIVEKIFYDNTTDVEDDAEALAKITELEQLLSKKTRKKVALDAFSIYLQKCRPLLKNSGLHFC